jgi:integrase
MSESDSTAAPAPGKPAKPAKPRPDFPLFPHAAGMWAKKIRSKLYYFGPWDDPDGAQRKYDAQKEALQAGRKPRLDAEAVTVKYAVNDFHIAKKALLDSGELSPHTFANYKRAAFNMAAHMGQSRLVADLDTQDFAALRNKMAKKWGPHRLAVTIQHIRSIFKHAFDAGLIPAPIRFGQEFNRPSKKTFRLHRAEQGPKLFTAQEVLALANGALVVGEEGLELVRAGASMRAMILLGINCGLGNGDCANLPLTALDLDGGWVNYPRPKTGIDRRCPLCPATVQALRDVLARRHEPKREEHAGLVFITKYGLSWGKDTTDNPVTKETAKLLRALRINGRKGLGFYTLRHTFRTVADESKDQVAVDYIMGHAREDMTSVYRERISDERLRAVADHVRAWLFSLKATSVSADAAARPGDQIRDKSPLLTAGQGQRAVQGGVTEDARSSLPPVPVSRSRTPRGRGRDGLPGVRGMSAERTKLPAPRWAYLRPPPGLSPEWQRVHRAIVDPVITVVHFRGIPNSTSGTRGFFKAWCETWRRNEFALSAGLQSVRGRAPRTWRAGFAVWNAVNPIGCLFCSASREFTDSDPVTNQVTDADDALRAVIGEKLAAFDALSLLEDVEATVVQECGAPLGGGDDGPAGGDRKPEIAPPAASETPLAICYISPQCSKDLAAMLRERGYTTATDNAVEMSLRRHRANCPDSYEGRDRDDRRRNEAEHLHRPEVWPLLVQHFEKT